MDALEWIRITCAVVGGAGVLLAEIVIYRDRMWKANEPWWGEGTHDEVRMFWR